jgi:parallel beta-helix repeat protein
VTLVIESTYGGEYSIDIQGNGKFLINSPSRSTTIQSSSGNPTFTYSFHNSGTVDFFGANVMYTYGSSATTGGIQNMPDSTCIINNCKILYPDTTGLSISSTTNIQFRGTGTIIGSEVDPGTYPGLYGYGIFVDGATPVIEDVTIQYQKLNGIRIQNSVSDTPISTINLLNYASSQYDYRLTYDAGGSTQPIISSGNGATYLAFQRPGTNQIFFKKTLDSGRTWTDEILIGSTSELRNMDFAADGNNLALVWEDFEDYMKLRVIYSSDGGESWTLPTEISLGYWPSIAVEGSNVYLIYRYIQFTGFPDFIMGVRLKWNGNGMLDLEETFENPLGGEFGGIPKVSVSNCIVHVVVADLTLYVDNIHYWRSSDNGDTWPDYTTIGTWTYTGSSAWDFTDYFSLDAEGSQVSLVWNDYNGINYEMKGIFTPDDGNNWYPINIPASTGNSLYPTTALDSSGNIVLTYQNNRDGTDRLYAQMFNALGNPMSTETSMTPSTSGANMPSVAIDNSGYAYLGWTDDRNGNSEIYIKRANHLVAKDNVVLLNYPTSGGIGLGTSSGGTIDNNIILGNDVSNQWGIGISGSNEIVITNNEISNTADGISVNSCNSNIVKDNTVADNGRGIIIQSLSSNNIITSNAVSRCGVGINLHLSCSGNTIDYNIISGGSYGIYIVRISGNTIIANTVQNNGYGIYVLDSLSNTITGNFVSYNNYGIYLLGSSNNIITNNEASSNNQNGISLCWWVSNNQPSVSNIITGNTANLNIYYGIFIQTSHSNTISNNIASNNGVGIYLKKAPYLGSHSNNPITDNTITYNNIYGIFIDGSSDNSPITTNIVSYNNFGIYMTGGIYPSSISYNTISYNTYGLWLVSPSNSNKVYHNNFIDNANQAWANNVNSWDNGYPSGGNYWSDYSGADNFNGVNQNIPGSDGIGDTPRAISGGSNQDRYPLMNPVP